MEKCNCLVCAVDPLFNHKDINHVLNVLRSCQYTREEKKRSVKKVGSTY
jgi:hypothetical protein